MDTKKTTIKRRLKGTIASIGMQNTAIISITRSIRHPKYGKNYKRSKKYAADTAGKQFVVGQAVTIEECRPLSKTKRWRIVN